MAEEEPPPPYSPAEQTPDLIPQPSISLRPSAPRSLSASVSNPGLLHPRPAAGPSSNVSLPTRVSASNASTKTNLELSAFKVVTRNITRQLVTLEDIETHLGLLRAFRLFKEKVENLYSDLEMSQIVPSIGREISVKGRWLWFLEMAVERFRRWVMLLAISEGFFVNPPVDVWLIWHTYLLNPTWYTEDCERLRLLRPLKYLKKQPLELAAAMGDNIFGYRPTGNQEGIWEAGTNLPFDPFVSSATLVELDVECPKCERQISTSLVNAQETGFAQVDFTTVCPHCNVLITRETMGVSKFIKDIILDPKDNAHVQIHGKGVYLPGTLLQPSGTFYTSSATRVKSNIKSLDVFQNKKPTKSPTQPSNGTDLWKRAIGERLRYSATELRNNCAKAPSVGDRTIRRILGSYVDGKPFSVELVAAATRQMTFVDKIHQLGWLNPGFSEDSEGALVLQCCILRYYGFLTLIGKEPDSKSFVPTLDIDLAWHTHQLTPANYSRDCKNIALRLIDHDDQVEESNLAAGLDKTSAAWWGRFGTPYMYCGCPVKEITVGQRLSRATSVFLSNPYRMEPPMSRDDCYAATHPSEHNSVFIIGRSGWKRDTRQAEWALRREKEGWEIKKGKRDGAMEERYLRGRGHEFPFLSPVPKTHGYGCPHAQQCYHAACAAGVSGCAVRA